MNSRTKRITQTDSTGKRIKQCMLGLGAMLLAPSIAFSTVNPIPNPATQQQTSIRSFHETTDLAETVWCNRERAERCTGIASVRDRDTNAAVSADVGI